MAYQRLADLRRQRGDLSGATTYCRQALDLIRRAEVAQDAAHAMLSHALAVLCRQQGQLNEAAKLLGQALDIDHIDRRDGHCPPRHVARVGQSRGGPR
jgi:tetratricopeptide (TPR) repeat protein